MPDDDQRVARIVATLKRSAAALRDAGIPLARAFFTMVEGLGVVEPA